MDFDKAKNYTILFLVIINLFLLGLNIKNYVSKGLSKEETENITAVLSDSGIDINTYIPKRADSLPQMELVEESFDLLALSGVFLGGEEEISRTEEFEETILSQGSKTLRINGSHLVFTDSGIRVSGEEEAEETAKSYIEKTADMFPEFAYEKTISSGNNIIVYYNMYYKGYNCFNGYCRFIFSEGGLKSEINYVKPIGMSGVRSEVYNADIILFSFMNGIRERYPSEISSDKRLVIDNISLGYLSEGNFEEKTEEALPCYRISLENNEKNYYINGYTAAFIEDFKG